MGLTSRERVRIAIGGGIPDRVPVHDMLWGTTITRWRSRGLPKGITPAEHFGYEIQEFWANLTPRYPVNKISEDDEYTTSTTPMGGIRRDRKDYSNTGQLIKAPIKQKRDWLEIKERLKADPKRVNWDLMRKQHDAAKHKGLYTVFQAGCGYDNLKNYIRDEDLLMLMIEDPEWIGDMADTVSELVCETLRLIQQEGITFDALWVWHDMGYKHHLFFSPDTYDNVFGDSDRKRNAFCHDMGMQTIIHSDGYVKDLVPQLIENGFDCLQPLEVKAGMSLKDLKELYGKQIALFGGIDVRVLERGDLSEIENEIREKFEAAKPNGGYLYHSDHSVSNRVSLKSYCFAMKCIEKYGKY